VAPVARRPGRSEERIVTPTESRQFDLTIIGSGPGGYVAAVRAGQLGLKTAVVEMAPLPGGTCLHWGCIPTKALLHAAEVLDTARQAKSFGIRISGAEPDLAGVQKYKTKTVRSNAKGVEYLFKKNKVTLLSGRGRLAGAGRVEVTPGDASPYVVETKHTILATGSVIRGLPGVEFDGRRVINSDDALGLDRVPASMIVLGAGAVGVEFASIYCSFGSEVTVVELLPSLIPFEDADLGKELEKAFVKRGIRSLTGAHVQSVEHGADSVILLAERDGETVRLESEVLLVAVGRRPLTEDLGLDGTGVVVDERGFVQVDEMMRTGEPGIYAVGDILASPALAHVASHEGIIAVEHAAGLDPRPIDYDRIPSCTYCRPEVASIGLSEQRARERGLEVAVGRFPFSASGKAKILNETLGFVKIVTDQRYDEIVGVHIIGPHATELLSEATAALNLEATAESLFHAVHAHPTLSEAMGEAALAVHGRPLHI
jgi:dihydrolipoamide dehydrogenase